MGWKLQEDEGTGGKTCGECRAWMLGPGGGERLAASSAGVQEGSVVDELLEGIVMIRGGIRGGGGGGGGAGPA